MDEHGLMMVMALKELMVLLGLVLARAMAANYVANHGNCQHWSSVRPCPLGGLTRGGVAGRPPKLAIIEQSPARAVQQQNMSVPTLLLRTFWVLPCEQHKLA